MREQIYEFIFWVWMLIDIYYIRINHINRASKIKDKNKRIQRGVEILNKHLLKISFWIILGIFGFYRFIYDFFGFWAWVFFLDISYLLIYFDSNNESLNSKVD